MLITAPTVVYTLSLHDALPIFVPGQVDISELVCDGNNTNTLNLNGWSHGTITNWVFSIDNGTTWSPIANTTTGHTFNNLTNETQYAVEIDGGFCPNDVSGVATITIQPIPVGGVINEIG